MSHRHILPLLAAAALFGAGCNRQKPMTVTTEKAQRRNLTEVMTGSGKLQPVMQVKISSEVAGEIIDLPVKEGQQVHKGDLLVRVRPDLYAAALRSQEASLKSSQADLLTAEANARKAEAELKRNEDLFSRQLISGSLIDEIRTGAEVARANAIASTQRIEMARASLKRSQEDLAKTIIFSPIDGTVSKLNSELGERVSGTGMMAGTDIMTVADLTKMEARVEVGEMDVVLIQPGFKARLDVDSFKDRKFDGQVTQVALFGQDHRRWLPARIHQVRGPYPHGRHRTFLAGHERDGRHRDALPDQCHYCSDSSRHHTHARLHVHRTRPKEDGVHFGGGQGTNRISGRQEDSQRGQTHRGGLRPRNR